VGCGYGERGNGFALSVGGGGYGEAKFKVFNWQASVRALAKMFSCMLMALIATLVLNCFPMCPLVDSEMGRRFLDAIMEFIKKAKKEGS